MQTWMQSSLLGWNRYPTCWLIVKELIYRWKSSTLIALAVPC